MTTDLDRSIRRIPHHPMPGILFYDIMPLLEDPACLGACVDRIVGWARDLRVDVVAAAEARGFILGGAIAHALGVGIACARKPGKLPFQVVRREYALEYGTDVLEIHHDAIRPGQRVLIHDDLLATGGTLAATAHLVEALGGVVAGIAVVVELTGLAGRERLAGYELLSLVAYDNESVAED